MSTILWYLLRGFSTKWSSLVDTKVYTELGIMMALSILFIANDSVWTPSLVKAFTTLIDGYQVYEIVLKAKNKRNSGTL